MSGGFVVWFTGLSGSGKSTLAARLAERLGATGVHVEALDGDEVRKYLSSGLGFSREDRDENVRRIGYVARVAARSGACAITAAISPYRAVRDEVRALAPRFCEIYCDCPLEVLAARDPKGLYKKALAGEIKNFTGVDDPYEAPLEPEIHLRTDRLSPEECETIIWERLEELGYIDQIEAAPPRLPPPYGAELVDVPQLPLDPDAKLPRVEIDASTAGACLAIAAGYLSPVGGFMPAREAEKVEKLGQLERGFAWPEPLVWQLPSGGAAPPPDTSVILRHGGVDLAELTVQDVTENGAGTVIGGRLRAVAPEMALDPSASECRARAQERGTAIVAIFETGPASARGAEALRAVARACPGSILLARGSELDAWRAALGTEALALLTLPAYLAERPQLWSIVAQNLGAERAVAGALPESPGESTPRESTQRAAEKP